MVILTHTNITMRGLVEAMKAYFLSRTQDMHRTQVWKGYGGLKFNESTIQASTRKEGATHYGQNIIASTINRKRQISAQVTP